MQIVVFTFTGQNLIPIEVAYTTDKGTTNFRLTYLRDLILSKGDIERGYLWFKTPDDFPYDLFFRGDLTKEYPSIISKEGDTVEFSIKLDKRIHKKTKKNPNGVFYMGGCGIQIK